MSVDLFLNTKCKCGSVNSQLSTVHQGRNNLGQQCHGGPDINREAKSEGKSVGPGKVEYISRPEPPLHKGTVIERDSRDSVDLSAVGDAARENAFNIFRVVLAEVVLPFN